MRFRHLRAIAPIALCASSAVAQAPDDAMQLSRRTIVTGVSYAHDRWDDYWEGTLKRSNGNIGTLTTQVVTVSAAYGLTDRIALSATLPHVWTHASQGVLHDMSGVQDLGIALKYRALSATSPRLGSLSAFLVGSAAVPLSDYTPDFMPLSIGTGGSRASGRLTLGYESTRSWFASASAAYTFCSNVKLNRSSYFTDGQLYLTNEVAMPNVMDYALTVGMARGRWRLPVSLVQQRTLGGGDIRRQDMPFVSNRMDFLRMDGALVYRLPVPSSLSARLGGSHVLTGRNVGQSTIITSGLSYAFHL